MTLVELMITVMILASLLTIGIVTLRGYFPKAYLITSAQIVEQGLERAQTEAVARNLWTCLTLDSSNSVQVYVDTGGNHYNASPACTGTGYSPIGAAIALKGRTTFASCSSPSFPMTIWFDTKGQPNTCASSSCTPGDFQIVVTNPQLFIKAKAREIEATSGGFIQIAKPGTKGIITTNWANSPTQTGGCE